jgi:hypothetical protein
VMSSTAASLAIYYRQFAFAQSTTCLVMMSMPPSAELVLVQELVIRYAYQKRDMSVF